MSHETTATEARHALSSIDHRRQQVIAEIDVPRWYWVSVATGWVALGVLAQYGATWAFVAGTLAFGTVHSAVAAWVLSGRHASTSLSIRSELVGRRVPVFVFGFLVGMTIVTVALALIAHVDGARNPGILASVVVAAFVLAGGPRLMASVRGHAERSRSAW
jgi:hypothetical protein